MDAPWLPSALAVRERGASGDETCGKTRTDCNLPSLRVRPGVRVGQRVVGRGPVGVSVPVPWVLCELIMQDGAWEPGSFWRYRVHV